MSTDYQNVINRKEWEFEFGQRDVHPALMTDFWLRSVRTNMQKGLKLPVKTPDYTFTAAYKGYIKSADKKDILDKFSKAALDRTYQQYIFDATMDVVEKYDREVDEIMLGLSEETSKEELISKWQKVDEQYLGMVVWFWIPWYLTEENILANRVKNGLEKYRTEIEKETDFNNALGALLFPLKEAHFQKEQRDFFAMVTSAKSKEDFRNDQQVIALMQEHLKKYAWMKTYFLLPIEPLSYEELVERVEDSLKGTQLQEFELQVEKKKEFESLSQKLQGLFKNNAILLQDIKDAQELGWLLAASVEGGIYSSAKMLPFLKIIAKRINIPYNRLIHLRSDEVLAMLQGTSTISKEEIEERVAGNAALMIDGKIHWMWGKEAEEYTAWIEAGVGVIDTDIKEFKGQPAYKGKVTGKVRIALTPDQAKELIDGEVLVTSMTSPDYVPAMRKAIAIVTNEGGLLSHAAIMSREFGKPCIVGTKIATKISE